jgi:hypothetical protein
MSYVKIDCMTALRRFSEEKLFFAGMEDGHKHPYDRKTIDQLIKRGSKSDPCDSAPSFFSWLTVGQWKGWQLAVDLYSPRLFRLIRNGVYNYVLWN